MPDRIIIPKSERVGTPEWAERLVEAIKADHRYSERDVSLFAEHAAEAKLNRIWDTVFDNAGTWDRFCIEYLNLPAAYVDAITVGVGVLRGQGYKGAIPADHAQKVAAGAENHKLLNGHGGDHKSVQYQDSNQNVDRVKPGENADYLTARIARDAPDILEDMKQGKYRSVRAAAIDAGIIDPERVKRYSLPANDPAAAGQYLAQRVDREWFEAMLDAFYKASGQE